MNPPEGTRWAWILLAALLATGILVFLATVIWNTPSS